MLRRLLFTLRSIAGRSRLESDMADEMRFHMEAYAADLERSGVPPEEARRRAAVEFGSAERAKEECRGAVKTQFADELVRNLRYALRGIARSPVYAAAVVLTLAICIGANTAIFSVVDAVLLRSLPLADADHLAEVVTRVRINGSFAGVQPSHTGMTWVALQDARLFSTAASTSGRSGVNLVANGKASYVQQQRVSAGYFDVLGVRPAMGREFSREEDVPGGPPVVVLSYKLWADVFGRDDKLLGATVLLRGEPHVVTGIMPRSFRPLVNADVWTPLRATRTGEGGGSNYRITARVKPGATWEQAQAETMAMGHRLVVEAGRRPELAGRLELMPFDAARSKAMQQPLSLLWAAAGVLLLIGCLNLAGLMLARSAARSREIGTRVALGSGRGSVIRQMLTETLVLACAGGLAGLLLVSGATTSLAVIAEKFGVWQEIRIDWRVAAMAFALTVLTSCVMGVAPAWQAARLDVRSALLEGGSRSVAGARSHFARKALILTQVALGVTLLVASGLLLRTLHHLQTMSPGFDSSNLITASVSLQDARYKTRDRVVWLFDRTLERLRSTSGVESAAVGLHVPYERWLNDSVRLASGPAPNSEPILTTLNYITPGYLQTLRIPLRSGRDIDGRDGSAGLPVALVNEAFARKFLRTTDIESGPVHLRMGSDSRLVVGVVGDVQQKPSIGGFGPIGAVPAVFVPLAQFPERSLQMVHTWFSPQWVVRGSGKLESLSTAILQAVESTDPLLPVAAFETFDEVRDGALLRQRFQAFLLTGFAAIALVLAGIGVYGLMAHSVVERSREMGIRMALGATGGGVLASAIVPGLRLALGGVAAGLCLSLGVSRLVGSAIYGVRPLDPPTFVTVAGVLLLVALLASALPALRLLRVDPAIALRQE